MHCQYTLLENQQNLDYYFITARSNGGTIRNGTTPNGLKSPNALTRPMNKQLLGK